MIRPWFRHAAVPWKTTVTQTRASGENRVSTKPGVLQIDEGEEPAETAARELEEETGYRAGSVEHLITFQPMVGMVDSEHVVFVGRDAEKIGEPTEGNEIERMEWVPLASVPGLIDAGEIWNSGSLVALMRLMLPER